MGDAFTLDARLNNSLKEKTEISEDFLLAQHMSSIPIAKIRKMFIKCTMYENVLNCTLKIWQA